MELFADAHHDDLRLLLADLIDQVFRNELYDYRAHDAFHAAAQKAVWAHQVSPLWRDPNPLEELLDRKRIRLIFELNVQLRQGWRNWHDGQTPASLDLYPAQELRRIGRPPDKPRDWQTRWMDAGGQLIAGRMIALRNDAVWLAISAFQYPFDPFDVHSAMRLRSMARREAMSLGIIDRDTLIPAVSTPPLRPGIFYFDCLPSGAFATPYQTVEERTAPIDGDDSPEQDADVERRETPGRDELSGVPYQVVEEITYFLKNCPNSLTNEKAAELMARLSEAIESKEMSFSAWYMARAYRCAGEIFDRLEQTVLAIEYYGYALQFDPGVGVKRRVGVLSKTVQNVP